MATKEDVINALNTALSEELAAIIQYMYHHVMATGRESPAIADMFRKFAMDEMKHAYWLAERVDFLGGVPTTKVADVKLSKDLTQMLQDNRQGELEAGVMYKGYMKLAREADDHVTAHELLEILEDEEGHVRDLEAILG